LFFSVAIYQLLGAFFYRWKRDANGEKIVQNGKKVFEFVAILTPGKIDKPHITLILTPGKIDKPHITLILTPDKIDKPHITLILSPGKPGVSIKVM
jgi:hypothetical protein